MYYGRMARDGIMPNNLLYRVVCLRTREIRSDIIRIICLYVIITGKVTDGFYEKASFNLQNKVNKI